MSKALMWRILFSRWGAAGAGSREAGYSLLLPVPADMPVFLRIALSVAARQDAAHLVETLVIPDRPGPAFAAEFERARRLYPADRALRLVGMRPLPRAMTRLSLQPHTNHWLQFLHGVREARAEYALLHDADLFLFDPGFLRRRYELASERGLDLLGVSPVWDEWYAANGLDHLAATWELLLRVSWAKRFAPWMHRGHVNEVKGKRHTFDTTLYPQCLTEPSRVGRDPMSGFVHFNYVICTFRFYQQAAGAPYEDDRYRLLLIRLLSDAFGDAVTAAALPEAAELESGLRDGGARVTYLKPETRAGYAEFRGKLEELIGSDLLDEGQRASMRGGVAGFDAALGWSAVEAGALAAPGVVA